MRFLTVSLFVVNACLLTGCFTQQYRHTVHVFGDVDIGRDEQLAERADELPWKADYSKVRVVMGRMPEGLLLSENGKTMLVAPGHESQYTIIGSATSTMETNGVGALYWYAPMHDSESSFRKAWCAWQAPFRAITLGIWSYFVPLNYACFPSGKPDVKLHVQELRRMATAMGGNLVVMTSTTNIVNAATHTTIARDIEMTGFVLIDRGPQPEATTTNTQQVTMR